MLPLIVGGYTLGLIELEASQSDHRFTAREVDLLTGLASQAAEALENAHLFEEAQQTSSLLAGSVHEVTTRVRGSTDADTLARAEAPELSRAEGRPAFGRQRRVEDLSPRPVAQQGHNGDGGRHKPSVRNRMLDMPRHWLVDKFPAWLPPLVIAGVLLLSLALPLVAPQRYWPFLIGLPIATGVILAFMLWPPLGLLALVVTALVVPSPYLPGGLNVAVLFLALLIGLWLAHTVLEKRGTRLVPSRTVKPLLGLVLVAVLAFGIGQLPWFAVVPMAPVESQLGGLAIFVLSVGAFLLVAHQVRDQRWLEWLTWLFLALGALFIAGWFVPGLGGIASRLFQRGATSNSMFWVWLLALAFSQAWLNRRLHWGWRLALAALVVATLYVALVRSGHWKSGWIPPLVAIAVIVGLRSWRAGLALALAGLVQAKDVFSQVIASDEYSYSTRLDAWKILLEMIKINPVTGFGPANYYWYTPLYRIRGYQVEFNSHNQYIDIVAQTGLLGLACVLWFFWEVARLGWRLRTRVSPGFAEAYVYGALGGLAGTLAAGIFVDWFLPFVYNIGLNGFRGSILPWLFLGGLVSLEQITQGQALSRAPEPGTV
jgi:O-antigen ligase